MPDMFFFRDPEEIEAEAAEKANKLAEEQAAAGLGEPRAVDWEVTGPGAGIANAAATMVGDVDWAAPEATTDWGRCPPSYVHLAPTTNLSVSCLSPEPQPLPTPPMPASGLLPLLTLLLRMLG